MAENITNQQTKKSLKEDLLRLSLQENPIQNYEYKPHEEEIKPVYYEAKMVEVSYTETECMAMVLKDQTPMVELAQKKDSESYVKRLVASITHDLRTPLNGILGITDSLREFVGDEGKHFLEIVKNTGTMMLYLIHDVLDLAQIEANKLSLNKAPFNPKEIVEETIQLMLFNFQQKNVSLVARYMKELPREIMSDKTRYRQILLNLLGNALKFTTHGSVSVAMHYDQRADMLITQVTDTGAGIASDELPKLFQIFGRLESTKGINPNGVGLGLHICKSLSQLLGGDIYVESQSSKGSSFTYYIECGIESEGGSIKPTEDYIKSILLNTHTNEDVEEEKEENNTLVRIESGSEVHHVPFVNVYQNYDRQAHKHQESIRTSIELETRCKCPKILLVDDNQVNLFMLTSYLSPIKDRVQVAYNGQEAIDRVRQKARGNCCKSYDVIYMDLNMPIMGGVEATVELRHLMEDSIIIPTPIIALSAEVMSEVETHDLCEHGFVSLLPKPISRAAFLESVCNYSNVLK